MLEDVLPLEILQHWLACPQSQGIPAIVGAVESSEVEISMARFSSFHQGLRLDLGNLAKDDGNKKCMQLLGQVQTYKIIEQGGHV